MALEGLVGWHVFRARQLGMLKTDNLLSGLKSDTVAALAVLPQYPRYYRGNGYNFYGITAVLGPKYAGFPWGWGQSCGTTVVMGLSFSHVYEN